MKETAKSINKYPTINLILIMTLIKLNSNNKILSISGTKSTKTQRFSNSSPTNISSSEKSMISPNLTLQKVHHLNSLPPNQSNHKLNLYLLSSSKKALNLQQSRQKILNRPKIKIKSKIKQLKNKNQNPLNHPPIGKSS